MLGELPDPQVDARGRHVARERSETLEAFAERLHLAGFVHDAAALHLYAALRYGGVGDRDATLAALRRATSGHARC